MAFKITGGCIACGSCKEDCPAGAIVENGGVFVITVECMECGSCMETCPSGAIVEG
ncbi:MAG TPA: 4Fe-4S binding protein [Nitrospirota bacterium]